MFRSFLSIRQARAVSFLSPVHSIHTADGTKTTRRSLNESLSLSLTDVDGHEFFISAVHHAENEREHLISSHRQDRSFGILSTRLLLDGFGDEEQI